MPHSLGAKNSVGLPSLGSGKDDGTTKNDFDFAVIRVARPPSAVSSATHAVPVPPKMIDRILSGGQTGVDRAALDVALDRDIPCSGWCPRGRVAEDGPIDSRYPLEETPTTDYAERTSWNVRDSDGTLVLTWGPPTGGTAFTIFCAQEQDKPCIIVDLATTPDPAPVRTWIEQHAIHALNVAGPRASTSPHVYAAARAFLHALFALE